MNDLPINHQLLSEIERLESEGAIVLVKWDGERRENKRTVVITRKDTNFAWRRDCTSISEALRAAIDDYSAAHAKADGDA